MGLFNLLIQVCSMPLPPPLHSSSSLSSFSSYCLINGVFLDYSFDYYFSVIFFPGVQLYLYWLFFDSSLFYLFLFKTILCFYISFVCCWLFLCFFFSASKFLIEYTRLGYLVFAFYFLYDFTVL